jgi:hypothetical protein
MFIYAFRQSDMCYSGPVEVPDGTSAIPPYHTFQAPPEQDGYHAVMQDGWVLVEGPTPPAPPPYVPSPEQILQQERERMVVSPFQGRMALINAGLMSQVEAMMADPSTPQETKVAWEYAIEWRRLSPLIETLGSALSLTAVQLDDLFKNAQQITV